MWYGLISHLKKQLSEGVKKHPVYLGSEIVTQADFGSEGTLIISRGNEEQGHTDVQQELLVTLYLETWIKEDSGELTDGYKKLADLEAEVEGVLSNFRKSIGELNENVCIFDDIWQILDISVREKRASDESYRPLYGTLYTIEARIYCLDETGGIW